MSSHAKSRSTCIATLPNTLNSLYKGMRLALKLPQRFVDKPLERRDGLFAPISETTWSVILEMGCVDRQGGEKSGHVRSIAS